MQTYSKAEFELKTENVVREVNSGKIFIHPTDTIYGLGCDATNSQAVKKLRAIKERYNRPFSVMVPDKTWIRQHCVVDAKAIEWLKKLPGPYTLILPLKKPNPIASEVNGGIDTIGVRIVDHWIGKLAEVLGKPIVTTSANRVGQNFMTSLDNLDPTIKSKIDFCIVEGEKLAKPSTLIDLTKEPESVKER